MIFAKMMNILESSSSVNKLAWKLVSSAEKLFISQTLEKILTSYRLCLPGTKLFLRAFTPENIPIGVRVLIESTLSGQ